MAIKIAGTEVINDNRELVLAKLTEIDASISDTAVDIFVYDTRKDSDGGAWRKRTQGTSWYNETLNTATRGSRKEFPAVAVIVTEDAKVTIYDGDDPDLPMWMVFNQPTSSGVNFMGTNARPVSAIRMLNGTLCIGFSIGGWGVSQISFISDSQRWFWSNSIYYQLTNTVSERNVEATSGYAQLESFGLVSALVNDVAMTVLPNAPIDAATGLPVPTIAVATDGGLSVIRDDGTVVDITAASQADYMDSVAFDSNGDLIFTWDSGVQPLKWVLFREIPSSDVDIATIYTTLDGFGLWGGTTRDSNTIPLASVKDEYVGEVIDGAFGTISGSGSSGKGIFKYDRDYQVFGNSLVNNITSDYNTGWMNGDIKLATLSDTDDTDVTGSELVTNGTFDSDVSSWVAGDAGSGVSYDSGTLLLTNNDNSPAFVGSAYFTTVVGKTYVFSFDVTARSNPSKQARILVVGQTAGIVTDSGAIYDVGSYSVTFTANDTSTQVLFSNGNQTASTGTFNFDNVSVRLAEEDRSVNGNGLQVFGTVTKNPVATGADLVAYSGFSASNYLEQPVNSDLTGAYDSCFMGWMKTSSTSGYQYLFAIGTSGTDVFGLAVLPTTGYLYAYDDVNGQDPSSTNVADEVWHHVCLIHKNGVNKQLYVDGKLINTFTTSSHTTSSDAKYRVGRYYTFSNEFEGSLALQRFSKTIPSPEQIKKIYEDEKVLFQENAQATLYGSSDAVTALAYDDSTNLLHVGTSAGRSVFQGLRRVDNTTTAVGAAISASNGLVADE
jgi:hypothetical protein